MVSYGNNRQSIICEYKWVLSPLLNAITDEEVRTEIGIVFQNFGKKEGLFALPDRLKKWKQIAIFFIFFYVNYLIWN